jgi:hypothetical protein
MAYLKNKSGMSQEGVYRFNFKKENLRNIVEKFNFLRLAGTRVEEKAAKLIADDKKIM